MASCIPTAQPQHSTSFPHALAVSCFPITAPQSNSPNTSRGAPLARAVSLAGSFASCGDGSSILAPRCCLGTTNIPSLGQRDIPSPEPLTPAKESQGRDRTAGRSRSYSGPPPWGCGHPTAWLSQRLSPPPAPTRPTEQPLPTSLPAPARQAEQLPPRHLSWLSQAAVKAQEGFCRHNFLPIPTAGLLPGVPPPARAVISSQ